MTVHRINIELYIGINKSVFQTWPVVETTDTEIDKYGAIWGEREVLQLGAHFNVYRRYPRGRRLRNRILVGSGIPASFEPLPNKLPGSSVSGNFGEVITILALEAQLLGRSLLVSHLCPARGHKELRCPDLIFEAAPLTQVYNSFRASFQQTQLWDTENITFPDLPLYLPGECKNQNVRGAVGQMAQYWKEAGSQNPAFGFGLISSINYRDQPVLKMFLLIPRDKAQLYAVLQGKNEQEVKRLMWPEIKQLFFGG